MPSGVRRGVRQLRILAFVGCTVTAVQTLIENFPNTLTQMTNYIRKNLVSFPVGHLNRISDSCGFLIMGLSLTDNNLAYAKPAVSQD